MHKNLKKMLLMVMMDQCSPKEFEYWLYAQEDLLNQMSDNLICAIFEINYNKIDNDSFKDCLLFKHYHLPLNDSLRRELMLCRIKTFFQYLTNSAHPFSVYNELIDSAHPFLVYGEPYNLLTELPRICELLSHIDWICSTGYNYLTENEDKTLKEYANELIQEIDMQESQNSEFDIFDSASE